MRKASLIWLVTGALLWASGCTGYSTQTGAAIGAGAGALAGQALGHNTRSTLLGTALGGITGAVVGNAIDKYNEQRYGPPPHPTWGRSDYNTGYGHWVTVPGQWVQGQWVPEHQVWVPDLPGWNSSPQLPPVPLKQETVMNRSGYPD
ncbi:MAG TPA: glycine zipper 2TM domain-containing protein [Candidatus Limnocylindrales bacterium]|nr:glycine zipper 2TM domain-containing protein [Candidatus Limnocylindrales bacterium]